MAQRRTIILSALLGCLCLAFTGQAQQIKPGIFIEFRKDTATTNLIRKTLVDFDSGAAATRAYIKRIADSVAALRSGQDYVVYRLFGVLASGASDSTNLQVGVNGVYEAILGNFNMAAFNFSLVATTPSSLISTWRTDLPALSNADSLFFIRISRNDAMSPKCAATIYKLPKAYGPDINDKTVGTFYDMIRFSDTILPAGSNKFFTFDLAMRRQP